MKLLKQSFYYTLPCITENEHFSNNFSKLVLDQTFNACQQQSINYMPHSSLTDFYVIPQIFG